MPSEAAAFHFHQRMAITVDPAGVPDRKLTGEAVDQVERDCERDRDARKHQYARVIRTNDSGLENEIQTKENGEYYQGDDEIAEIPGHSSLSLDFLLGDRPEQSGGPEK